MLDMDGTENKCKLKKNKFPLAEKKESSGAKCDACSMHSKSLKIEI